MNDRNANYIKYLNGNYIKNTIIESVVNQAIVYTKNKFGIEIDIKGYERISFLRWLKKYDKNYKNHITNYHEVIRTKNDKAIVDIHDKKFLIKLERDTFMYVSVGPLFNNRREDEYTSNVFKVYIFGKKCYKYFKEVSKALEDSSYNTKMIFKVSTKASSYNENSSNMIVNSTVLSDRKINTLFFDDNIKDKICNHIDAFFNNISLYHERSLTFKTGVLLYGEPGTGKSSLVKALATYYTLDVISIDMNTFEDLNVDELVQIINNDNNNYIVLLEDIDTIIKSREDNIDKDDNKNINKLLQFLDSNTSPDSVIFIATTNHIDRLDAALTRDGRFDIKVKVNPLKTNSRAVSEMAKSFNLKDEDIIKIYKDINNKPYIAQSELQNIILKYVTN